MNIVAVRQKKNVVLLVFLFFFCTMTRSRLNTDPKQEEECWAVFLKYSAEKTTQLIHDINKKKNCAETSFFSFINIKIAFAPHGRSFPELLDMFQCHDFTRSFHLEGRCIHYRPP